MAMTTSIARPKRTSSQGPIAAQVSSAQLKSFCTPRSSSSSASTIRLMASRRVSVIHHVAAPINAAGARSMSPASWTGFSCSWR